MKSTKQLNTIGAALSCALAIATTATMTASLLSSTGCAGDRYNRSTGEFIDDHSVKSRVETALGDSPDYKFGDVQVTVFKGTVQLSGFVDMASQKSRAGDIAKSVQGVRSVSNDITVKDSSNLTEGQNVDDKAISSHVRDALSDNVEYKFDGVNVSVTKATVQLGGFVNTDGQKSRAGDLARNVSGVKSVVNNIIVKAKMD